MQEEYKEKEIKQSRPQGVLTAMFAAIAPRYDLLNDLLSLGIQRLWRRALYRELKGRHFALALDLCTGSGALLGGLAGHCGTIIGLDICKAMMRQAHKMISRELLGKVSFVEADVHELPFPEACADLLTVAFGVRNFRELREGLREMSRVLKDDGLLLVLELGQPRNGVLRSLYSAYSSHVLPLFGALVAGNSEAYSYLHRTAAVFPCDKTFASILEESGFQVEKVKALSSGIAYLYKARRYSQRRL